MTSLAFARALALGGLVHVAALLAIELPVGQAIQVSGWTAALAFASDLALGSLLRSRRAPRMTTTTAGLSCNGQTLPPVTTTSPAGTPPSVHLRKHLSEICAALEAAGCSCDQ